MLDQLRFSAATLHIFKLKTSSVVEPLLCSYAYIKVRFRQQYVNVGVRVSEAPRLSRLSAIQ